MKTKEFYIKENLDKLNSGKIKIDAKHYTCICPDEYTLDFSRNGFQTLNFSKINGIWVNVE
jgi:hypothetical protein